MSSTPHSGRLARLGDLAYRRRGRMLVACLAVLVTAVAAGIVFGGDYAADYSTPGSESAQATTLLQQRFGGANGESVDVVWRSDAGARSPAVKRRVDAFVAAAQRVPGIGSARGAPRVSRDGKTATLSLPLDRRSWDVPTSSGERLIALARRSDSGGLQLAVGGGVIMAAQSGGGPEVYGIGIAALILLVAFGSIVAAGLPLLTALYGVGMASVLGIALASVVDVPEWSPAVASLIGIGVGVDYALLVLTRFRAALGDGADTRAALVESVATAGRSVLVAGTTVLISLLGLFLMRVGYLQGVALAASLSVLVVMLASVTLLPAMLAFLGPRVNRLRLPTPRRRSRGDDRPTLAARWSAGVQRRPWLALIAGAAVLIAIAIPATGLKLGFPDAGNDDPGKMTRTAYDLQKQGFGAGSAGPLVLAVDLRGAQDGPAVARRIARAAGSADGVSFASAPVYDRARDAAIVSVVSATTPQSTQTADVVDRLRDDVLPKAVGDSGAAVHIGGTTASFVDQAELVSGRLPLFALGVLGLSFLVLLLAFRAPLIALKAGLMNLLSVGAAYGVIALASGGGIVGDLIGIPDAIPVAPFVPVMMFAILFGLSMDYEVFLLSRVREEYLAHGDTSRAVADGLTNTARVITAAAAIMVGVFLAFLFGDVVFLKLLGIGMAAAIFVDATVVRMLLVPALMQLLGRWNWWLPGWLDRALPSVELEPAAAR